ncbi:hypothetical protein [Rhizobacter sp. Root404]|uniref:hypothetical protein n=1 Tax=Rhizobacter sp. Root404 TaxID=1736528 RepID=UPI000701D99D|nr:hypothetical protein [Rhizobacter sp. Root404]KQW36741.1 hypothetical protein ASC76_19080 [Rhizobacter sp. Root404]
MNPIEQTRFQQLRMQFGCFMARVLARCGLVHKSSFDLLGAYVDNLEAEHAAQQERLHRQIDTAREHRDISHRASLAKNTALEAAQRSFDNKVHELEATRRKVIELDQKLVQTKFDYDSVLRARASDPRPAEHQQLLDSYLQMTTAFEGCLRKTKYEDADTGVTLRRGDLVTVNGCDAEYLGQTKTHLALFSPDTRRWIVEKKEDFYPAAVAAQPVQLIVSRSED